ncbi:MAG: hypothetical protein ACMXX5_01205 [Candidatus Woesearchaeota archaeon]
MKTIFFAFIVFLMLALTSGFAFADNDLKAREICDFLIEEKGIGSGDIAIPRFIPYKNDAINAFTIEGSTIGSIKIKDGIIVSAECDLAENQDFIVRVSDIEMIKGIFSSDSVIESLNDAIKNRQIIIEGQTFAKRAKSFFSRMSIRIASFFA